ncbi:MAG: 4-hydroxy-tetrahydrodipicolinate reductase [Actinomycetota bacterium]|nr:4-hydroxy-tetrahydrodipicolinate reductase [Actinomycetota bacterium]
MPDKIKVVVVGARGKMGETVCRAVLSDGDLELVGAVDTKDIGTIVPMSDGVVISPSLKELLAAGAAEVVVDFTRADAILGNAAIAAAAGAHLVIGATGLLSDEIDKLKEVAAQHGANILLAPNFALGAVIMMKISQKIAGYFDRAEIIELHHDQKHDAPSGTAILTAEMVAENLRPEPLDEVEKRPGARGAKVNEIPIHSVRLPGLVAHQEVIFGLLGQTLTIRHDSIDRSSFMPGVVMAIKRIKSQPGFTYGLDKLLDL